ncbi:hypothetical protein Pcinc_028780 [Petrolisthes cinctipes]|uniref:Uncharacterized protein n=1 Tax=Petrolisthes cinctipes TaxID=88211 RepID=A0AAE1F1C1_PETCI|nr:hypothetical protein Pcinc_028780 [Petrolisthes cinctipes]
MGGAGGCMGGGGLEGAWEGLEGAWEGLDGAWEGQEGAWVAERSGGGGKTHLQETKTREGLKGGKQRRKTNPYKRGWRHNQGLNTTRSLVASKFLVTSESLKLKSIFPGLIKMRDD